MRLAEFKMRLFIFFAGTLRKLAGSIEQATIDEHSRPTTPVDGSSAVLPAEPSRESGAASGPPEHWARLVATAPPQHWLDLIRQKAPYLLSPTENEPVSPQAGENISGESFETEGSQETGDLLSKESGAGKRSEPPPRRQSRDKPENPLAQARRTRWLNRLRFQPPMRRSADAEPVYVSEDQTGDQDAPESSTSAGSGAREGSESSLSLRLRSDKATGQMQDQRPDRRTAASETMRSRDRANEEHEVNAPERNQPAGTEPVERRETYPEANVQETLRAHSFEQSWPEQGPPEVVNDTARGTRPSVPFERGDTNSTRARSGSSKVSSGDSAVETDPRKRATLFGELDRLRRVNFEDAREETRSSLVFRQTSANESAVNPNRVRSRLEQDTERHREALQRSARKVVDNISRASELASAANRRATNQPASARGLSRKPEVNVAGSDEPERNFFASVDLAAPALVEPGENVWPTLLAASRFEIADELAAMEREAETLRRLDQEQRGTLWNA